MLGIHGLPARRLAASPRRRHALIVEGLEDRLLLSGSPTTYTVDLTSDSGASTGAFAGDILYCVTQANANPNTAGSRIQFDPTRFATPQTITLTSTLILAEKDGPEVIKGPGENLVTVSGNNAVGVFWVGFQLDNVNAEGPTATISGLTISSGHALSYPDYGGGIWNNGTLTVSDCTIANNTANYGGCIDNGGTLIVSYCTIDYNISVFGGGIYNEYSSTERAVSLTVSNSTIAHNTALGSQGSGGGGIWDDGALTVFNSTIAYNSAYSGGGIDDDSGLTVSNSTIAYNKASASSGGGGLSGFGRVTLNNTIVAGNHSGTSADDIPNTLQVNPSAYNLIGTGGSPGLTNGVNGNQVGVANPGLATALADNGGPTQTIALLKGSPAIDKGSNTLAVDPNTNQPLATDQRGFPRIVNNTVDIGAYEFQVTAPLATHLVVIAQPPGSVTAGSGFSLIVAAENSLGNVDPTFNGSVTIALANNPGGSTLNGTLTVAAVNGLATFSGVTLNQPGNGYTLQVSGGGLTSATTAAFNVTSPLPPPSPPTLIRELVLFTQKRNKKGKPVGKPVLSGFEFDFNTAMNQTSAANFANYKIGTYVTKHVRRKRVQVLQPVGFTVSFNASNNSVKLLLSGKQAFTKGGQITLMAGISSAAGAFLGNNAVYNISPGGGSITLA
ncbi:choice-of-anchor Q domain-containing protein [Mycobacterium sp.]|uniref:choice-of-anchor Q domain-containing protein n=1 Tax=Mycobacterium sp. TaxID=1785 RepID=UPI003F94DCD3